MRTLGVVVVIASLAALGAGFISPRLRLIGIAGAVVLVFVTAWMVWAGMLFFQVVRLDPILRLFHLDRLGPFTRPIVFFGPPLLAAVVFGTVVLLRRGWLER